MIELVKTALKKLALKIMARSEKPLSDKMMKSMIPMFVDSDTPDDHKCGICNMRTRENSAESCVIVKGGISYRLGTCTFWANGPASHWSKIHENRMNYAVAGYIEVPEGVKVQCGTCKVYDQADQKAGHCTLWNGGIKKGQCCVAFTNPEEYVPKQGQPGRPA